MDTEKIQQQLDKVSPILKRVYFSPEIAEKIAKIGEEGGLLLDQIEDLIGETGYMVIGLKPSRDYVENISNLLGIKRDIAVKIAQEINDRVLKEVREEIRKLNETPQDEKEEIVTPVSVPSQPTIPPTTVEKAADILINRRSPSTSPQYNDSNLKKEAVLNDLENIEKLTPENAPDFVEHLLGNPVQSPQQVEIKKVVPPAPQKKYEADPYREQI